MTIRGDQHPTLPRCACGHCFDCPDGWHYGADLPCFCTPDCVGFADCGCANDTECDCDGDATVIVVPTGDFL